MPNFKGQWTTSFDPSDTVSAPDFSALAPGFFVNIVMHKTVVEVDETGTVAAAATGIGLTEAATRQAVMTMNHPFIYAIRDDKTGELLFIGILMNPS